MLLSFAWIAGISATFYCTTLLFLLLGILRLRRPNPTEQPGVSVIIAARNEAKNLPKCLEALSAQTYPESLTEIIIVNNLSEDDSSRVLANWQENLSNLKIIHLTDIPAAISPKKHALSCGIGEASSNILFTTDADCMPSPEWLQTMVQYLQPDTGAVVGPAPLKPHGWLGSLVALESLANIAVSAGGCGWNIAITATGRNFAYRKSVFEEVSGFGEADKILSGDDDLFLQRVRQKSKWRIDFALAREAAVPSPSVCTIRDYIRQRRRHVSAGKSYTPRLKLGYLVVNSSNVVLVAFLITTLIARSHIGLALSLFTFKLIAEFTLLLIVAKRLNSYRLLLHFPLWQLFSIVNQILISPLGFVGKIRW